MKSENLFPARLTRVRLGCRAWLFLVGVSPSPVMGLVTYEGVPFEAVESLRLQAAGHPGHRGARAPFGLERGSPHPASGLDLAPGPVATVLLLVADGAAGIGATALLACVDAATFMLWLCFFGHN